MIARYSALFLLLAAAPGLAQEADGPPTPGRQVVSVEELRAAGVTRFDEIVGLAAGWDAAGVDGFTWWLSPRGLDFYGRPGWEVRIDGQPLELGLFGVRSLNRLPVSLWAIDSVAFHSVPGSAGVGSAAGGRIQIHTRRPAEGLSIRGHAATGNETGDPGPFFFTDRATPNVDRIGSAGAGSISYRAGGVYLEASGSVGERFVTDRRVRRRNQAITVADEIPIMEYAAGSLRAGLEVGDASHHLLVGHSSTQDYFFLQPFGREVPVESPFTHIGLDGVVPLPGDGRLSYRAAYSRNALERHPNTLGLDYDWAIEHWRARTEGRWRRRAYDISIGARLERTVAGTGFGLDDDAYVLAGLHGSFAYRPAATGGAALHLSMVGSGDGIAFDGALSGRVSPGRAHRLEAALSYTERLPEEDGRIWFWFQRGYDFLPRNGVAVEMDARLGEARRVSADVDWRMRLGAADELTLGAYARRFSGLALEDQLFRLDSAGIPWGGDVRLVGSRSGEVVGAGVALRSTRVPHLELLARYRFQDAVGGDSLFRAEWKPIPRSTAELVADYRPRPDLSLYASIRYRGSTRWPDYINAGAESGGLYSPDVEAAADLTVAVGKWLLGRRLRTSFAVRNVLNDTAPYHPIGAAYDLSLFVQGELALDGILFGGRRAGRARVPR